MVLTLLVFKQCKVARTAWSGPFQGPQLFCWRSYLERAWHRVGAASCFRLRPSAAHLVFRVPWPQVPLLPLVFSSPPLSSGDPILTIPVELQVHLVLIWQDCFRVVVFLWARREPFPHRCCVLSERLPSVTSSATLIEQLTGTQEKVLCLGPACVGLPMLAGSRYFGSDIAVVLSQNFMKESQECLPLVCLPVCIPQVSSFLPSWKGTIAVWNPSQASQCAV